MKSGLNMLRYKGRELRSELVARGVAARVTLVTWLPS